MALTPAEKMRAYRERQKANKQKPVSFLLDCDIAEKVTSYAERHQTTQADIFNQLLRDSFDGNKLPSNNTVTSYQDKIKALEGKNELLAIELENSTRDINNMNARYEMLSNELKAAKGKQAHKGHDAKYWCENYERQKREFDVLEKRLKELENKFDIGTGKTCQCVTGNCTQCTRPADKLIQVNDLMFWACKQHRAKYPNATQVF